MNRLFTLLLFLTLALTACDSVDSLSEIDAPATKAPAVTFDAVTLSSGPTVASIQQRATKTTVCHYDADTDTYNAISVAERAYPAHMDHGDGVPGGAVPSAPDQIFDEACRPIASTQPYTCEYERGQDEIGRSIITMWLRLAEPRTTPVTGGNTLVNARLMDFTNDHGWIRDAAGKNIGYWSTFTRMDPAQDAFATLHYKVYTREGELDEHFTCGPYIFGAA